MLRQAERCGGIGTDRMPRQAAGYAGRVRLTYNVGMSQITLVLPFALPVPEFAPDLVRALGTSTPALAALLTRTTSAARIPANDAVRALPHEQWLAGALGLQDAGRPAFAAAAMRALGVAPDAGHWFIVNPVHIEIARTHLMLQDPAYLNLTEADSRALFETAQPSFEEAGHALVFGDAGTWFMRADDWAGLDTATLESTLGMDLTDWMPLGARAAAFRRLQNEVQILWHAHPVNAQREARRLAPVNAFWSWGASDAAHVRAPGAPRLAAFEAGAVVNALADVRLAGLGDLAAHLDGDAIVYCASAAPYALSADWGGWVARVQQLEAALFAPILESLKKGRVRAVRLVLTNRDAHAECTTNALAQRTFWRRPTLDKLL